MCVCMCACGWIVVCILQPIFLLSFFLDCTKHNSNSYWYKKNYEKNYVFQEPVSELSGTFAHSAQMMYFRKKGKIELQNYATGELKSTVILRKFAKLKSGKSSSVCWLTYTLSPHIHLAALSVWHTHTLTYGNTQKYTEFGHFRFLSCCFKSAPQKSLIITESLLFELNMWSLVAKTVVHSVFIYSISYIKPLEINI